MRMIWSSRFWHESAWAAGGSGYVTWTTHLEALVLQHTLDGSILSAGRQLGLENDAEGAIADDFALRVGEVLVVARHAVLHLLADDFWRGSAFEAGDARGDTMAGTHLPFSVTKRPMAGSGSLYGKQR
jgi:hypothetical protein